MLTRKQAHVLRYLMAQEAYESCLCFKDSRCLARGLFFGCQNCGSFHVVRRRAPKGQPDHTYLCRECGQRGAANDFLVVRASAEIVNRRRA